MVVVKVRVVSHISRPVDGLRFHVRSGELYDSKGLLETRQFRTYEQDTDSYRFKQCA